MKYSYTFAVILVILNVDVNNRFLFCSARPEIGLNGTKSIQNITQLVKSECHFVDTEFE